MQKQLVAQQSDQMQVQWAHEEHKVRYSPNSPARAVIDFQDPLYADASIFVSRLLPVARVQEFAMDEEQIRELKGKLAERQTALDACLKGTGKVRTTPTSKA